MISSSVTNIACPMCSRPVTLGGGIGMMKHCFSSSWWPVGLKYPDFSHQLYSRCSTSVGEYCVDMSSGSSSTSVGHATSCMRAGAPRRHSKSPAGGAPAVPPLSLHVPNRRSHVANALVGGVAAVSALRPATAA